MRAAVSRAGRLVVEEVPEPSPAQGQVLVAPRACGICGSDLHFLQRQQQRAAKRPERNRAVVMGHEFCAEVVDWGPGTPARLPTGSLVTSVPYLARPRSELLGFSSTHPGGFGELMVLEAGLVVPVPGGVMPEHAALTEPLAVGLHAVNRAEMERDALACVVGCGPVGLAVISALRARGHAGRIVAADPSSVRRDIAVQFGADDVLVPGAGGPVDDWGRYGAEDGPPSPLLAGSRRPTAPVTVFDCVGRQGVLESIISSVPRHSRLIVVGVCLEPDTFVPRKAIDRELSVEFVFAYTQKEFSVCLSLIAGGRIEVASLVTKTVDLEGLDEACQTLGRDPNEIKVVAVPSPHRRDEEEEMGNEVRQ